MTLGAQRAMISLFGPAYQYILAEATATPLDLQCDSLLLGCCLLPKEKSICLHVEALQLSDASDNLTIADGSALVVPDIRENSRFKQSNLAENLSKIRFYAGVPIISPRGFTIGSYCVMDQEPRKIELDESSIRFMKDMAETVMEHLSMVQSKSRNHQTAKMIVGLGSFAEGSATLRDSWHEASEQNAATGRSGETLEGQLNKRQQDIQKVEDIPETQHLPYCPASRVSSKPSGPHTVRKDPGFDVKPTTNSASLASNGAVPKLIWNHPNSTEANQQQKTTFRSSVSMDGAPDVMAPPASEEIFPRAANLIRESIEVEGVVFLDARVESFGELDEDEYRKAREAWRHGTTTSSDESTDSGSPPNPMHPFTLGIGSKDTITCRMLGFSTSTSSSIDDDKASHNPAIPTSLLKAILSRYPHGKIFNYNENGLLSDDGSGSSTSRSSETNACSKRRKGGRKPSHTQNANALIEVLEGARSIIFLPLWDSHKARWHSAVLVWTKIPERVFTPETELAYLRAFGNSVMAEMHRFDAVIAEKAKTDLISNISHELRSPLHGILGTAEILSDTAMDVLQQGMIHTIESCGRTLLDTINHLLDFTYMKKYRSDSKENHADLETQMDVSGRKRAKLQRNPQSSSERAYGPVQLDSILEEVVESVFAGHSFYHHPRAQSHNETDSGYSMSISLPTKQVTIIFDIQEATDWTFLTSSGCWRRILMNLFGNALKYTPSGFIYVGLKASPHDRQISDGSADSTASEGQNSQRLVTLTVKDTGKGIDAGYLQDGLFTPFSQEDDLAPGSGLGLSIVREALVSIGGSMEVTSEKGHGTEITIEVPLDIAPATEEADGGSSNESYRQIRKSSRGKTIGLLGFPSPLVSLRAITLYKSLKRLCQDWFHLTVKRVSLPRHDNDACDFYMTVQTDLDGSDEEKNHLLTVDAIIDGKVCGTSPLIVICESPEKAHNLFARAANRRGDCIIEYISQPCGPRKLAKTLSLCILRLDGQDPEANKPTHWVEIPDSSKMQLDVGPRDPPKERMKIGKRPMLGTMGSLGKDRPKSDFDDQIKHITSIAEGKPPSTAAKDTVSDELSVLLVDDNHINLQILVAFVKKEGWNYMTATNGLQAVEAFQAHPGKFAGVILGMQTSVSISTHSN
jgi:signal transduction histidine kinase